MAMRNEVGREMKVSELSPQMVVWLAKEGRDTMASVWVVEVGPIYVHFRAAAVGIELFLERRGPDLEAITDNTHTPMHIFEFRGVA